MKALTLLGGILMLAGMIIGAGMFAIPYSFAHAGFWLGTAELFFLAIVVLVLHLSYAEIVTSTTETHRLPGYAGLYLGTWGRAIASGSVFLSAIGTLLVYLLLGSRFLADFLRVGGWISFPTGTISLDLLLVSVILLLGAVITFFPLKGEALINGILTAILILFIGVLVYTIMPLGEIPNVGGWEWGNAFIPYGILLFALWGGVVIPDVATFLGKDPSRTRSVVAVGTLLPALLYFLFAFGVVSISGPLTSREALQGLLGVVPEEVILLGSLIGLLAVFTSYILLGKTFQAMLTLDFGVPKIFSWILASGIPFLLYLFGFTDFIIAISIIGAIAIGCDALLILLMHYRMKKMAGEVMSLTYFGVRALLFLIVAGGIFYHLVVAGRL